MTEIDRLRELVSGYARGEIDDEDFLRQLDTQHIDLAKREESEKSDFDASLARTHAAIRRIGRL